nr:MAG TPA: hypothetical protein [Caudoviricetes sp.]
MSQIFVSFKVYAPFRSFLVLFRYAYYPQTLLKANRDRLFVFFFIS